MGRERIRRIGRNRECKDVRIIAKALVLSELIAIFHPRDGKS